VVFAGEIGYMVKLGLDEKKLINLVIPGMLNLPK